MPRTNSPHFLLRFTLASVPEVQKDLSQLRTLFVDLWNLERFLTISLLMI
jgi:hypothetical protein